MPETLSDDLQSYSEGLPEFKELAHNLGLTPSQAQQIIDFDIKRQSEGVNKNKTTIEEQEAKLNKEFNQLAKETFGDRESEVIDNAKKLIAKYTNNDLSNRVQDLDNSSLMVISAVLDGVTKDYIGEDKLSKGDSVHTSQEDLISTAKKLMTQEAFRDPFHPEHARVKKEVESTYQRVYG
jgi:hypothetical protein